MEEQRHDYPDILQRLSSIEKKVNGGLADQFKDLKQHNDERWDRHDSEAREFRHEIRSDVRELTKAITERPCISHTEQIKTLTSDRDKWVAFAIVCVGFIIAGLIAWGSLKQQVDINTHRWDNLIEGKSFK